MGQHRLSCSDADPAHSGMRRKDCITPSVAKPDQFRSRRTKCRHTPRFLDRMDHQRQGRNSLPHGDGSFRNHYCQNWRPHFCRGRSRALITYLMHSDDFRHPCKESRTFQSGKCTELSPGFKSCSRNAGFSWMSKNRSLGPTTQSDKVEEYCFD